MDRKEELATRIIMIKKEWEPDSPWLGSLTNKFAILSRVVDNISISCCNLNSSILREVTVKLD